MSSSSRSRASVSGGKIRVTFPGVMANIATGRPEDSSASPSEGLSSGRSDGITTGRSGKEVAFRFGDAEDSNRFLR